VTAPTYLTVAEVVKRLDGKVARSTIYDLVKRGTLRASKVGGKVLIHADSLDALLNPPAPEAPEPAPEPPQQPAPTRPARGKRTIKLW
jgi:excisionase family DNA binding protein